MSSGTSIIIVKPKNQPMTVNALTYKGVLPLAAYYYARYEQ